MKCLWEGCESDEIDDIKAHMQEHTKSFQDYKCKWSDCQRKNEPLNKNSFVTHLRIHTGEKPYKCQKCLKDFARADALNKHAKRHEVEDKNIQEFVDKIFYQSEIRDFENYYTRILLNERQFRISCVRLLEDELRYNSDKQQDDSWDDYL